jgi:nucleoside-diphosphate-sugar epimerase
VRIAIFGATGNVGTSVLAALQDEPAVQEIVAIARRPAQFADSRVRFVAADVAHDRLDEHLDGVDAVIHLAWLIQPSRDDRQLEAVNVQGSRRVFEAAARAGVKTLAYASSVGAYSPGPKHARVDESWPTAGIDSLFYARHKAQVERILDRFQAAHPDTRVVRMRPGLIFKRDAATGIRRLFAGPLLPGWLLRPSLVPIVPDLARLRFQAVHSLDVGQAFREAVIGQASGAFNLAADPVIDPQVLGEIFSARPVRVRAGVLRAAVDLTWRARLQPSPAGWLDMGLAVPLMDTARARAQLGWRPGYTSTDALSELIDGLRSGADHDSPPLAAATSGRFRLRELRGGLGARDPDVRS